MRDPSKAASAATQRSVQAGLYLLLSVVWFVFISAAVGGAWLAIGLLYVGLAWRARGRKSTPPV